MDEEHKKTKSEFKIDGDDDKESHEHTHSHSEDYSDDQHKEEVTKKDNKSKLPEGVGSKAAKTEEDGSDNYDDDEKYSVPPSYTDNDSQAKSANNFTKEGKSDAKEF